MVELLMRVSVKEDDGGLTLQFFEDKDASPSTATFGFIVPLNIAGQPPAVTPEKCLFLVHEFANQLIRQMTNKLTRLGGKLRLGTAEHP